MTAKNQIPVFALGAAALVTLATTIIIAAHYWDMLSGVWLVAIVGLLLPDWVAWWCTYWYAKADQVQRVKIVALIVAALMTVTMIGNAGAVLATWWDTKERAAWEGRESAEALQEASKRSDERNKAASNRSTEAQKMKAAGLSQRNIDTFLKSETRLDNAPETAKAPAPKRPPFQSRVPEPVQRYMGFWVYLVPFLVGLLGKFMVVTAITLPGGVEFSDPRRAEPQREKPAPRPDREKPVEWPDQIDSNGDPKPKSNRK